MSEKLNELLNLIPSEQVAFTNRTFFKPTLYKTDPEFWAKLENQAKLVQEELNEVFEAIGEKDISKLRDGVCDVEVTNLGIAHLAGLPVEQDMLEVFKSNLSKVSPTLKSAADTATHYFDIGVKTVVHQCPTMEGYVVLVSEDCHDNKGKFYPKGKFLKDIHNFKEPNFN